MPDAAGNVLAPTSARLTATDGSPDKFRIKIWRTADDSIVYDNQTGWQ
jgi:hypothetical protein